MTEILALIVIALSGALGTAGWWYQRSRRNWHAQLKAASTSALQRESELLSTHQAELTDQKEIQKAEIVALRGSHEKAMTEQRRINSDLRERLRLGAGESASRVHIIEACREAGLDAVVLSNVLFRPVGSREDKVFHAQVDHLVVTDKSFLIVESKYWRYATFDGVDFCSESRVLRALFGDLAPEEPGELAVRFYREGDRVGLDISSPATQVRRQAPRLRSYLQALGIPVPWIDTCVYYCHPDGVVVHTDRHGTTDVVSTRESLRRTITRVGGMSNAPVDLAAVVDALAPSSTDITGTGAHSERWPDITDSVTRCTRTPSVPPSNLNSPGPR